MADLILGKLAQHDADDGYHAGDGRGGKQVDPAAPAQLGQADDSAGDAGAQDAAQDHRHRLTELHQPGVDKAHAHH